MSDELTRIVESARRLGVEVDEAEAVQWLAAMAAWDKDDDIVYDPDSGVFGHAITMLDFSSQELAYFRKIGQLVEFEDEPGVVETALALSGSAAQSKIQSFPGDADYFERINIRAETQEAALAILARVIREKALNAEKGSTYQLIAVRFGSYPADVVRDGRSYQAGSSIEWRPEEIRAEQIEAFYEDGRRAVIRWQEAAQDPGWCKLDWIIADPIRGKLSNASNMLDVTWEDGDGRVTPLDGYLDPYFQEVYLEAESIPVFSKLVKHVSDDALENYVHQLEKEVKKYIGGDGDHNYGKAAKRMYNIFRYTGRYQEAAFLRELFDEPTTVLYQVWALVRTLDEALLPNSGISLNAVYRQADELILSVVENLEGDAEVEVVRALLHVRHALMGKEEDEAQWQAEVTAARSATINIVNNFFQEKLTAMPQIKLYLAQFQ